MELNVLELEFLVRVGWRIVPKGEVLDEYYRSLVGRCPSKYAISVTSLSGHKASDALPGPSSTSAPSERSQDASSSASEGGKTSR